jgi:hypothetical protein
MTGRVYSRFKRLANQYIFHSWLVALRAPHRACCAILFAFLEHTFLVFALESGTRTIAFIACLCCILISIFISWRAGTCCSAQSARENSFCRAGVVVHCSLICFDNPSGLCRYTQWPVALEYSLPGLVEAVSPLRGVVLWPWVLPAVLRREFLSRCLAGPPCRESSRGARSAFSPLSPAVPLPAVGLPAVPCWAARCPACLSGPPGVLECFWPLSGPFRENERSSR